MDYGIGNVHPDCPNAPNPYHECTARCFERITYGDVPKKEKKLFGFVKTNPIKTTPPGSPARVIAGNRSPRPSFYAKKKLESDDSPSYSSSEDNFAATFFTRQTPPRGHPSQPKNVSRYNAAAETDSLPMSPSLAVYTERNQITSRFDRRRVEPESQLSADADSPPRTSTTRPRTPEHRPRMSPTAEHRPSTTETRPMTPEHHSRTPERQTRTPEHRRRMPTTPERRPSTPETRSRTPERRSITSEHHPRSRTPEVRPRTPDHQLNTLETRQSTAEYRARTPDHRARSPGPRARTPEPQARYLEPRARTPEPRARTPEPGPRIPQTQPTFHGAGQRSPRTYNADSLYSEDDDESVLLHPELLLSPQERPASRPITPVRRGNATPTKQEEYDQLAESQSSDDNFSFLDEQEDRSVYLHPEIITSSSDAKPRSGSNTPVHHKFRTSSGEQEETLKQDEPPELPDESQSFSRSEIARMRGLKHYETQSMVSESYVSVGNYKVRESLSATVQHIFDKHGDIASGSKLQSMVTRSYYLENLATMVLELQSTPLRELKETRVAEMLVMVKDIESVKIQAGWFRSLLEEILEAAKHFDSHKSAVVEKERCERDLSLGKQEMEVGLKELAKKEKETKEWRERVTEMGGRLGTLEMKRLRLEKSLAFLSSKVDKFQGTSVLEDIL